MALPRDGAGILAHQEVEIGAAVGLQHGIDVEFRVAALVAGRLGRPRGAPAGKLGVVGMMNTLKIEGAKNDIKINAVCPIAATRMTEGLMPQAMLDNLKPEYVTPGVINLVKEDAPTGMILSAGAGAFSMAQIVETKGAFVAQGAALTAEAVAAKWAQITDTSVQTHFDSGSGHGGNIFARLQEAAQKA